MANLDFVESMEIARGVLAQYKLDHLKWWRRMDGTPILNDLAVRMAIAFLKAERERTKFYFHCPQCGYDHKKAGRLFTQDEEDCPICLKNKSRQIRLDRWQEGTDEPSSFIPSK